MPNKRQQTRKGLCCIVRHFIGTYVVCCQYPAAPSAGRDVLPVDFVGLGTGPGSTQYFPGWGSYRDASTLATYARPSKTPQNTTETHENEPARRGDITIHFARNFDFISYLPLKHGPKPRHFLALVKPYLREDVPRAGCLHRGRIRSQRNATGASG